MKLTQLRDFVAAVQSGSLRGAARGLGISQPAMSKSIRQLEGELQVQLVRRSARGVVPTPAGKSLLARARVVQAELRKAEEDLQSLRGGLEGRVAFGIGPAACMLLVPEALTRFRSRYPHASVRVLEGPNSALLPQVRDETLDFSVNQKPYGAPDAAMRFKPLFRLRMVIAGRRGHPLRGATRLSQLAQAPWLMFHPAGTGASLENAFSAAGLALPRAMVQCESYATALALLSRTDTLGLVIPQLLELSPGQGLIEAFDLKDTLPAPTLGMYLRKDTPLAPAAAAMANAIADAARRLARS